MRNSQLAVLCAVIVAAALIVAGGNFALVELAQAGHGPRASAGDRRRAGRRPPGRKKLVVAMMPKSKGNAYFIACQKGAEEAAKELGVELLWDGPTEPDPAKQNKIVETWITREVDVIAVAVENPGGLSTALRKAREAGIKVVTWDADAGEDARDFFCNQATPEGIGDTLMDTAAKLMGGEGKFAIITGSLTAANLNVWRDRIAQRAKDFPKINCAEIVYCDDKQNVAFDLGKQMLNKYPDLKLIMAICSPAVPGAAEAVKQSGRTGREGDRPRPAEREQEVRPRRRHAGRRSCGTRPTSATWPSTRPRRPTNGTLKPGDKTFEAGRLGKLNDRGHGHHPRQAVRVHEGEHRPVRFLSGELHTEKLNPKMP